VKKKKIEEKEKIMQTLEKKFVFHKNSRTFDDLEFILKEKVMTGGELLDDLRTKFDNYEALKNAPDTGHPKISSDCKEHLKWINKLNILILYPVLMAGIEKYSKDDFTKLCDILLKWFFRVKTVANKNASALEVELAEIAYEILYNDLPVEDFTKKEIEKDEAGNEIEKEITLDGVRSKLSKSQYNTSDDGFENDLKEITMGNIVATYILTKIIEKQQHQKITDVVPSSKITLEHIMPQSGIDNKVTLSKLKDDGTPEKDPDGNEIKENFVWLDYIKKTNNITDDRDAKSFHQNYYNKLGNLTLVDKQKNSVLGINPFGRKCYSGKDKNGVEKGCFKNSHIQITREIVNWNEWNKNSIDERQVALALIAKDIWKI